MKKLLPVLKDGAFIAVGSALLAVGINCFLAPNKISSGGVSSIGTALLHLFGVKLFITNIIANILLFALGVKFLNRGSVLKTIVGILALTVFLGFSEFLPVYQGDRILAAAAGGALSGAGLGLVVRRSASTGGSDFAALMLRRWFPHISVANLILVLDAAIIVISGIVFKSLEITLYSLGAMYIATLVADAVATFGERAKAVRIFSDSWEQIAAVITENFNRGATGIYCRGIYSGEDKIMLLSIVTPKELPRLVSAVKSIDDGAFLVISDAREVFGEGFSSYAP